MGFFEPFRLERFFAAHEFEAKHLLCTSDCESISVAELCAMEPGSADALAAQRLGYTESRGSPPLRADIASLYRGLGTEDILVHSGAEEAVLALYMAVLEKGDRVVVNQPCYQSLAEIPRALGAEVLPWTFRQTAGRWFLDPDELEKILDGCERDGGRGAKLVVLNTPHNPTGALMRKDEFARVIGICRRHGALLFCDEVYRLLERDPTARLDAACEAYENGISLSVLSKAWGLAGLRIGWLATRRRDILDSVAAVKDYSTICASAPSETLAGIAVRNAGRIVGRNRALCASNLALLERFFALRPNMFSWFAPEGGSIGFPKLGPEAAALVAYAAGSPAKGSQTLAEAFAAELLRGAGVLLLPGANYGDYPAHFRAGFGRSSMPEALEKLDSWLADRGFRA